MKIYIACQINGNKNYLQQFYEAETKIMDKLGDSAAVLNPAHLPEGMTSGEYMRICFAMIDCADTLVLLPNAILSKGALLEAQYANYVGKPVYILDEWLDKPIINAR